MDVENTGTIMRSIRTNKRSIKKRKRLMGFILCIAIIAGVIICKSALNTLINNSKLVEGR